MSGKGILVVDMQREFMCDPLTPRDPAELVLQLYGIRQILKYGSGASIPMFFTEFPRFLPTEQCLTEVLGPTDYQKITKEDTSAFNGTSLDQLLIKKGVHSLALMGVNASRCILYTALDALTLGFQVTTSPDIITDTTPSLMNRKDILDIYREQTYFLANYEQVIEWLKTDPSKGLFTINL